MDKDTMAGMDLDNAETMEFHYFKLHDYDNNNKLDGLELGAAMTHYHETDGDGKMKQVNYDSQLP